jgi:hypothetical protein
MNLSQHIGKTIKSINLTNDNYNCVTTEIKIIFTDETFMIVKAQYSRIDNELKKYLETR